VLESEKTRALLSWRMARGTEGYAAIRRV